MHHYYTLKKLTLATACAVVCPFLMNGPASHADLIQSYDFEDPALHATQWNVVAVPVGDNGWTDLGVDDTAVVPSSYDLGSIQGNRIIRSWNRGVTTPPTAAPIITDGPTGAIRTHPFVLVPDAQFDFLIGGGNHPWGAMDPDNLAGGPTSFNLEQEVAPGDWTTIFTATGPNANTLAPASWDASAFAGGTVRLAIYDLNSGGWGHIDVDNIVYSGTAIPEPSTILLSLLGILVLQTSVRNRRT